MLRIVSKLFQERTNIINKQFILANNLHKNYKLNNTPFLSRDYRKLTEYQNKISDKERQIHKYQMKK